MADIVNIGKICNWLVTYTGKRKKKRKEQKYTD